MRLSCSLKFVLDSIQSLNSPKAIVRVELISHVCCAGERPMIEATTPWGLSPSIGRMTMPTIAKAGSISSSHDPVTALERTHSMAFHSG